MTNVDELKRYSILTPSGEYSNTLSLQFTADTLEEVEQHLKDDYGFLRLYRETVVMERLPIATKVTVDVNR